MPVFWYLKENGIRSYIKLLDHEKRKSSGCEHKARCLYKYNANIQSETGILKRQTRSIQTEGHFRDIKENEDFRRFNYRSAEKVYKEFNIRG